VTRRSAAARLACPALAACLLLAALAPGVASGQGAPGGPPAAERPAPDGDELVQLDFNNIELSVVIDTIAKLTGKNFIYDDRVRGRVTVVSPTRISVDEAYAVFESVLQVKGFTTVPTPGGALKVIPIRDAKETSVPTDRSKRPPINRDLFITRLIPLQYIDAESIVNTLKPLVSKDAAIAAYQPTNTVILTESASNIRRLISILEEIDVDAYREDLALIHLEYADAATMAQQLSDIYGVEVSGAAATPPGRARRAAPAPGQAAPVMQSPLRNVRIITDERTNSLIVLAARTQIEEVRNLARKLDVPVAGGGRVHVYYLQHADAEELSQTLNSLISGAPAPAAGGGPAGVAGAASPAQTLRAVVAGLAEGITVTADPPTNSLVIQASQEGYAALRAVIEKLDIERPQVLVEALIMEVDVTDSQDLGSEFLFRFINDNVEIVTSQVDGDVTAAAAAALAGPLGPLLADAFVPPANGETPPDSEFDSTNGTLIQGIIRAAADDNNSNIISAPHILTSDNEEAEIIVGDNIPIISSRVESAQGITTPTTNGQLATSVNVERQDIGVTLRVTPQITEGNTLRLDIFQEITALNPGLTVATTAASGQSGVALSNRKVENTVVVNDGQTVVIGGILTDDYSDTVSKVPWLGDIPVLGWAFKTVQRKLEKKNLLVFLTPHIVRTRDDLEHETIRKRQEFESAAEQALGLDDETRERELSGRREALTEGTIYASAIDLNPASNRLLDHTARYPLERMREIEEQRQLERRQSEAAARRGTAGYLVQAVVAGDERDAMDALTRLVDAGYDGTLASTQVGAAVVHEVRIGPYDSLEEAQRAAEAIRRSEGLTPALIVEPPEPEGE
jgi:general secretion pathway protein D